MGNREYEVGTADEDQPCHEQHESRVYFAGHCLASWDESGGRLHRKETPGSAKPF